MRVLISCLLILTACHSDGPTAGSDGSSLLHAAGRRAAHDCGAGQPGRRGDLVVTGAKLTGPRETAWFKLPNPGDAATRSPHTSRSAGRATAATVTVLSRTMAATGISSLRFLRPLAAWSARCASPRWPPASSPGYRDIRTSRPPSHWIGHPSPSPLPPGLATNVHSPVTDSPGVVSAALGCFRHYHRRRRRRSRCWT